MEEILREIQSTLGQVTERLGRLEESTAKRFDRLEGRFDRLETVYTHQMQQINQHFHRLKTANAETDARLCALEERVTNLEIGKV